MKQRNEAMGHGTWYFRIVFRYMHIKLPWYEVQFESLRDAENWVTQTKNILIEGVYDRTGTAIITNWYNPFCGSGEIITKQKERRKNVLILCKGEADTLWEPNIDP